MSDTEPETATSSPPDGPAETSLLRSFGLPSAAALVVANIIGAGIFTTTGFQAADLGHPGWILALWVLGGLLALAGALCYAELGAAMPEAGGEYVYLRETFGPMLAFMSAFVSLVAGFSAPIAAASKALVRYLAHFAPELTAPSSAMGVAREQWIAIAFVWLLVAVHLRGAGGVRANDLLTVLKVFGIVAICVAAFALGRGQVGNLVTVSPRHQELGLPGLFAALGTSLIFVGFCYTGWNAAGYIAAEMKAPQRDLPRALLLGTGVVIVLYLGLNLVYLYGADVDQLAGRVEVGLVAARNLFGPVGVAAMTAVLAVSIFASMSAMTIAGPRVYYAFGRDFPPARGLTRLTRRGGAPFVALLLQGGVTSALILSGTVDQIQQYAGFTLTLFTSLAVLAVIVLRHRRPELPRPFRAWGYPWTPLFFLSVSVWTMAWALRGRPLESLLALLTVGVGGALFALLRRLQRGGA